MNARFGIFGGTFNPVHLGHLRAAEEVAEALDLDRMLFVPSAQPPHKSGDDEDPIADAATRLAWLEAAVRDNPRFSVERLEIERGGRSYTVDTLRALSERAAPELPVFVIGQDAFVEMGTWREPETIFASAHVVVMTRPPAPRGTLAEWIPEVVRDDYEVAPDGASGKHRRAGSWIRVVEITALDISASDVRRRLREGRSVRYLLPPEVRSAVEASGVYGPAR